MKKRTKIPYKKSKRQFSRASGTHRINLPRAQPMRGGIRL